MTQDRHECFSVFHHLQKDKQRKQHHTLKLGKKRQESSKRNYYIISPRVIIKAIIIISRPRIREWTNRNPISHELICSKICFTKTESVQ